MIKIDRGKKGVHWLELEDGSPIPVERIGGRVVGSFRHTFYQEIGGTRIFLVVNPLHQKNKWIARTFQEVSQSGAA